MLPLALGGNVFGWTADEQTSHQVLDAYTSAGGDFIDTAEVYSAWGDGNEGGESERVIGSWLRASGKRDDVVIATKVSQHPKFPGLSASNVAAAARASLERLGTDRIDLYYAHFDDQDTPLEETVRAFDQLVREGLVRYTAISNYSRARAEEWIRIAKAESLALPVAIQPHYTLVTREPYESEIAPLAAAEGLGVVAYFALAAGFLTGKYRTKDDFAGKDREGQVSGYFSDQGLAVVDALDTIAQAHGVEIASVALAWLQAQPNLVAPIASARNTEHLPALLASADLTLSEEELQTLTVASAKVPASAECEPAVAFTWCGPVRRLGRPSPWGRSLQLIYSLRRFLDRSASRLLHDRRRVPRACGLTIGHSGLHQHRGLDVSADWNDVEEALGFPRRRHS